jgi:hypothetical protein
VKQPIQSELQGFIKGSVRFEHLITGASDTYKKRREEIATSAYNPPLIRLKNASLKARTDLPKISKYRVKECGLQILSPT